MSTEKPLTNYRNVYKSDHLGVIDLEEMTERGTALVFTIDYVKQEFRTAVAGKKIDANIAYFKEKIKPLVLNATNARTLKELTGSNMIENWSGTKVELFVDATVKMKGEIVGGVRIRKVKPVEKAKEAFTKARFEKAKAAGATIPQIKAHYSVTAEVEAQYLEYANA